MKYVWSVLFLLCLSPKGFAQESGLDQIDPTPTIVDTDSSSGAPARSEFDQAQMSVPEANSRAEHTDLSAEAQSYAREFRATQAREKREAARAKKETKITTAQGRVLQRQMKADMVKTSLLEKKIQRSRQAVAKAQEHRKALLNQKLAADNKLKVVAEKSRANEKAVRQAVQSVKVAAIEAKSAKRQLQVAQQRYARAQRIAHQKVLRSRTQVAKYKTDTLRFKKAKRKIDKSVAMLPVE